MSAENGRSPEKPHPRANGEKGVTRRDFVKTLGATAAASSFAAAAQGRGIVDQPEPGPPVLGPGPAPITLDINDTPVRLVVEPATTLLEALRLHAGLTGAKEICDRGSCGGCSVIIDGLVVNACMTLAVDCIGSRITTIEGLARNGALDPVQQSFIRHDALQCGYCTPGLVMACRALLDKLPKPTLDQIMRGLSGNICRCGTYTNVFNAALEASGQPPIMDQKGAQR